MPTNDAERERLISAGYKFYTMDYMPSIGRMEYEELIENDIVYVGTPESVGDKMEELYEDFRFDEGNNHQSLRRPGTGTGAAYATAFCRSFNAEDEG